MPIVPAGDLLKLRSSPQTTKLYMVIQQPARAHVLEDLVWSGEIRDDPDADPATELLVTANMGCPAGTIKDGMTVVISKVDYGFADVATLYAHGDQAMAGGGANETIYISVSSELAGVDDGDYVAVLDEHLYHSRYPRILEDSGTLYWYKDYGYFADSIGTADPADLGLTWTQLGGTDAARRQASQPAVPIMGPHVVQFIDPGGSVDVDFDWSDSYAVAEGATVDEWVSEGETDHVGGAWNDNVETPGAKTYSEISGLRGFRVTLDIGTDLTDPIDEFTRGVRYVFTLRRPGEIQAGDPTDAYPITDFRVDSLSGDYASGGWTAQVTAYGSQASELLIRPGALVILFAEDAYAGTAGSVGPDATMLSGRENIVMVGYIGDGSIVVDSETGETTFAVLSLAELMKLRENYTVPIENDSAADEWYKTPDLTVNRAAHHYLAWHTNVYLVADCYHTSDTSELAAQDFLASNTYSTIDTFLWDRLFARLLCDRFGRLKMMKDQQIQGPGTATTLFTLAATDWVDEIRITEVNERPVSSISLGGLNHNGGVITPYMSIAPAAISRYSGSPQQMTSLVIPDQATLNLLSGRYLAYLNNAYPDIVVPLAGDWRVADIWPQEYVVLNMDTGRHEFTAVKSIVRGISFEHDPAAGALLTTLNLEVETDGPQGASVDIPDEIPDLPWQPPYYPPIEPPSDGIVVDGGARIIATNVGVFGTNKISENTVWFSVNNGLPAASLKCWRIMRDPWHWWTSGGTERTLWGIFTHAVSGLPFYIYKLENYPYGTWALQYSASSIPGAGATPHITDVRGSVEVEDRVYGLGSVGGALGGAAYLLRTDNGGVAWSTYALSVNTEPPAWSALPDGTPPTRRNQMNIAHHSAGQTVYVGFRPSLGWRRATGGGSTVWIYSAPAGFDGNNGCFSFAVPYISATHNDSVGYLISDQFTGVAELQRSDNLNTAAPTWTQVGVGTGGINQRFIGFGVCPADANRICTVISNKAGATIQVYLSLDRGATWTLWASTGGVRTAGFAYITWSGVALESILCYDQRAPAMLLITSGATVDVTGNLLSVAVGLEKVSNIDRDTMGGA